MKTAAKTAALCIGLIILISALSGCGRKTEDADQGVYTSIEELSGKRIGIQMGSILDRMTEDHIPDVKIFYFNSFPDTVVALKSNQIDAFPVAGMAFSQYQATDDSLVLVEGEIGALPMAYVFPKNDPDITDRLPVSGSKGLFLSKDLFQKALITAKNGSLAVERLFQA